MTMKTRSFLSFCAALVLAGCSATGPRFTPTDAPKGSALLYVYRPDSLTLGARTAAIEVNGRRAVGLKNNGYALIKLTPGKYEITQSWDSWLGDNTKLQQPISVSLAIGADSVTYLRLGTASSTSPGSNASGFSMTINWELRQMAVKQAVAELSSTNRVELDAKFAL